MKVKITGVQYIDINAAISVESSSATALEPSVIRRNKKKNNLLTNILWLTAGSQLTSYKQLYASHQAESLSHGYKQSYIQSWVSELVQYMATSPPQLCRLLPVQSLCLLLFLVLSLLGFVWGHTSDSLFLTPHSREETSAQPAQALGSPGTGSEDADAVSEPPCDEMTASSLRTCLFSDRWREFRWPFYNSIRHHLGKQLISLPPFPLFFSLASVL